jgi:hypothetical protein
VQPNVLVTTTVYVPAVVTVMLWVVAPPGDHSQVLPATPGAVSVVLDPAQMLSVGVKVMLPGGGTGLTVMVCVLEAVQPAAVVPVSVTV